jgi:hypothetical protein
MYSTFVQEFNTGCVTHFYFLTVFTVSRIWFLVIRFLLGFRY